MQNVFFLQCGQLLVVGRGAVDLLRFGIGPFLNEAHGVGVILGAEIVVAQIAGLFPGAWRCFDLLKLFQKFLPGAGFQRVADVHQQMGVHGLLMHFFCFQFFQAVGRRSGCRHAEREDGFQTETLGKMQQLPQVFLGAAAVSGLPVSALDPAAADAQAAGHEMHACHDDGAVLCPYVCDGLIAQNDNGCRCAGEHVGCAGAGCGHLFQCLFIFHNDQFPGTAVAAGRGKKTRLYDLCHCVFRDRGAGILSDTAPVLHDFQ